MSALSQQPVSGSVQLGMPLDVAEWIGAVALARQTAVVAQELNPVAESPQHAASEEVPPSLMLAVFTYGLARGIHDSSELERRAAAEPGLRHLCGTRVPSARALRSYRRRHGARIREALTAVLGACWKDCEEVDQLRPALQAEAQQRLECSMRADSLSAEN